MKQTAEVPAVPETTRHAARRQLALLFAAFVPLFLGPGALQIHLKSIYETAEVVVSRDAFLAIAYGTMGLSRLIVGWTVRRVGSRPALALGASAYALFAAAQWPGLNGWWLVPVAMAFGFGGAWVWLMGGSAVLDLSRRAAFGRAVGLLYFCSAFSQAAGILGLGLLIASGYARLAVALAAGLGLTAVAVFSRRWQGHLRSKRPRKVLRLSWVVRPASLKFRVPRWGVPTARPDEPPRLRTLLKFATDRRIMIVGLFLLVGSLPFGLILGAFRDHVSTLAPVWAVVPCFFLARSILSLLGGGLVDRLGRTRSLAAAFAVGAVALFAVPWFNATTGLAVAALMMGIQMSLIPVAGTAMVGDMTHGPHRPVALGVLFFWRDVGAVLGILLGSTLTALLGPAGFRVFGGVLAVFAVLSLVLSRSAEGRQAVGGAGA